MKCSMMCIMEGTVDMLCTMEHTVEPIPNAGQLDPEPWYDVRHLHPRPPPLPLLGWSIEYRRSAPNAAPDVLL